MGLVQTDNVVPTPGMKSLSSAQRYHPLRDFTPLSLLLRAPLILVASYASECRSIGGLIETARTATLPLTYGSSAIGGAPHVAAPLFARRAGITLRHVRYSDTRQLYADLVAGTVDLSFNNLMSPLPLIRQDKLVALGITDAKLHPTLAHVPPIASAGISDYTLTNWLGIVGPARLDRMFIADIEAALKHAVQTSAPETKGPEIVPSTAGEFQTHLKREWQFWPPVIRDLNLQRSE